MNILVFGSSGFIGKRVTEILRQYHHVKTPSSRDIDFTQPDSLDSQKVAQLLQGIDVVINMVGLMRHDKNVMENVHHITPLKISQIAKIQGVKMWINLSALGANPAHEVAFVGSKGRGDTALLALNDEDFRVKIARPSLVFGLGENGGKGGASTEMFLKLASLPVIALPKGGNFAIQPVSVDDVARGLVNLAIGKNSKNLPPIINFTGKNVMTLAEYLTALRTHILHKSNPKILPIPMPLAKFSAQTLQHFIGMISVDSLVLLEQGNVADNTDFVKLLGHAPSLTMTG